MVSHKAPSSWPNQGILITTPTVLRSRVAPTRPREAQLGICVAYPPANSRAAISHYTNDQELLDTVLDLYTSQDS